MKVLHAESGPRATSRTSTLIPPMAEINVIPLVDVTLVLLIIFMITATFTKTAHHDPKMSHEVALTLPYAAVSSESPQNSDEFVLAVDKQGQRYVAGNPVTTDMLMEQVKAAAAVDPHRRVRIDADQDARFQSVVELMELCQFEGMRNVGVRVRDRKQVP